MEEVAVYISLKNSNSYVKNSIISLVKKYCNLKKYNYEIDFMIVKKKKICPIEVKSSNYMSHKSFD